MNFSIYTVLSIPFLLCSVTVLKKSKEFLYLIFFVTGMMLFLKCVDGLFLLMVLSAPKRFRMYVVRFQECPVNFHEFHEFEA